MYYKSRVPFFYARYFFIGRAVRCTTTVSPLKSSCGKKGKTFNNGAKSNNTVIAAVTARLDALVTAKWPEAQVTTEGTGNRDNDALRQRPHGPSEWNISTLIWYLGYVGQTGETNR
jgi:hypothetical protein